MRLSGLTRSGERMAEFPANNQRSLLASIVFAFGLVVVFYPLSSILSDQWGEPVRCLGAFPARSMKAVQSIWGH